MKLLITSLILLLSLASTAQSPSLTINVLMDTFDVGATRYKIEMKKCEPIHKTKRGSWFSHDTSTIDFASLKAADIKCDTYFDKGMPELISGQGEVVKINSFKFSNQVFAWENIYIFKIANMSSRGWWPEMYIVLPIRYKSFVTHVDLTGIEFRSGEVIFLTQLNPVYTNSGLSISRSLKTLPSVEVKDFPLKELLEKN